MRLTRVLPALIVAGSLLLTGCGTRADDAEIRAGAGDSGKVTLSQESLDKLRAATAGSGAVPGAGVPAVGIPTGVVDTGSLKPGAPGTSGAPAAPGPA
nr:hypothetical protein [Sporichthya sp.]